MPFEGLVAKPAVYGSNDLQNRASESAMLPTCWSLYRNGLPEIRRPVDVRQFIVRQSRQVNPFRVEHFGWVLLSEEDRVPYDAENVILVAQRSTSVVRIRAIKGCGEVVRELAIP